MAAKHFVSLSADEINVEKTSLSERLLFPFTPVKLIKENATERDLAESYIAECFFTRYQATINYFLPYLLVSSDSNGMTSAIGLKSAAASPLFLEHYLTGPIESAISTLVGKTVERSDVVEVGNLTSTKQGSTQMMFVLTAAILNQANFKWMVFTSTKQVRGILDKLAMPYYDISAANPELLPDKGQSWGNYYDNGPIVVAAYIPNAMVFLNNHRAASFVLEQYSESISQFSDEVRCA